MEELISKLILYSGNLGILNTISYAFEAKEREEISAPEFERIINQNLKEIISLGVKYNFSGNLWHNYITYLILTDENPFSLSCERKEAPDDALSMLARHDLEIFRKLFDFKILADDALNGIIENFKCSSGDEHIGSIISDLSKKIACSDNSDEIFDLITSHYKNYGVGIFGINSAFRVEEEDGKPVLLPVNSSKFKLDDIVGYNRQKEQLLYNTKAFVEKRAANNVLLYGDSGTGKSSSVKALVREFSDCGLRMIEVYKHQFGQLGTIISMLSARNYRFIILIDDLSFEEHEVEYKFLKAVIEGGVEAAPDNVVIYATSNRRHLIKETWKDRDDMEYGEIHRSDTVEEKLSLASRFGVTINYSVPNKKEYNEIVLALAKKEGLTGMSEDELISEANKWELRHGGFSGRTARQFINYCLGK